MGAGTRPNFDALGDASLPKYGTIRVVTAPGESLPSGATKGGIRLFPNPGIPDELPVGTAFVEFIDGRHAASLIENYPSIPAEQESAEALAEPDALAHVIAQAQARRGPRPQDTPEDMLNDIVAILDSAPAVSLAAHDAEVKAQGQASALRQISNAVRDPDKLMGLSPHALADVLWAEAEKHDPVERARARAAAREEHSRG